MTGQFSHTRFGPLRPGRCGLVAKRIASFDNVWTLKFKDQRTNGFFAIVNQIFGGSPQLPTVWTRKQYLVVVGSWDGPLNS